MAHSVTFAIALGAGSAGLTLSAQIKDTSGNNVDGLVTTGFVDLTGGNYSWTGSIPDGQQGTVEFLSLGVVKAIASLNPAETEERPTAQQIDTQLSSVHGTGLWGPAGTGANVVTLTVQDSGAAPVIGALVTIKNSAGNATVAGPMSTNTAGQAPFNLDNGNYLALVQSSPFYATLAPVTPVGATLAASTLRILTYGDYEAVRKSLDLSLDEAALPSEIIELPVFGPAGESDVLERDPYSLGYQTTDTVAWERVRRAAIWFTAARLAPAVPALTMERLGDWSMSRKETDFGALAATLRGRAAAELAQNVTGSSPAPLPSFTLACGRRGA